MLNLFISIRAAFFLLLATYACQLAAQDSHDGERSQQVQVIMESARREIISTLEDKGDYYYRKDGKKVAFYRKKDIYAIRGNKPERGMQRIKARYHDRVEKVERHNLAGRTIIKVSNQRQPFEINAGMLKSLDRNIEEITPVLANQYGRGDIILKEGIRVRVNDGADVRDVLQRLQNRFQLRYGKELNASRNIHSLVAPTMPTDISDQFATVRAIMRDRDVDWAEPLFDVRPYKMAHEPTDPEFVKQWYLQNKGLKGSRCDTDCDATDAWDSGNAATSGSGVVIAVVDDGIDLGHEDLNIVNTQNPGEMGDDGINNGLDKHNNGIDDDGNGCIDDDVLGCDFVDDDVTAGDMCGEDATRGPDGDPSPQATTNCLIGGLTPIEEDDHGTAVAGIAAAKENNATGIVGTAYSASILPIRAISAYDTTSGVSEDDDICDNLAEAMTYAGRYADVIVNSWGLDIECPTTLEPVIEDIVEGVLKDGSNNNISKRPLTGSPVIFSSGNDASGWVKITVNGITAGEHAFEWRFLRAPFNDGNETTNADTAWLDDIRWPDGSIEGFESGLNDFTNQCGLNDCDDCQAPDLVCANWAINSADAVHVRSGTKSAMLDMSSAVCANSYLHTKRNTVSGKLSFWVWVSTELHNNVYDRFEFLIDGQEKVSFGDKGRLVNDGIIAYPASLSGSIDGVIAVGASDAGDLNETTSSASLQAESRVFYSQYGAELDVLAPSSNQHLGITTTDRTGSDGYSTGNYTDTFGGTSAAAPIVAGIAAAMIAVEPSLTAAQVRTHIRNSADKVGPIAYTSDGSGGTRNDHHGYGRVNMYQALQLASGGSASTPSPSCAADPFTFVDLFAASFAPQPTEFCPASGPLVDELCVPIKASNGNIAVVCL